MERVIWTLWWQGEQAAPPIVQLCLASMRRHANGAQVRVLDRDSYTQYITLPDHILRRVEAGQITITHLSDLIRMRLLSQYGGLWLDSTVFVTGDIPPETFELPFYSIRLRGEGYYLPKGRWCGYVLGGNDPLFGQVSRMLEGYWQDHTDMADYLLVDYCIDRCYDLLPGARAAIDGVPFFEGSKGELIRNWSKDMRPEQLQGRFQKVSWKVSYADLTENSLLRRLLAEYGIDISQTLSVSTQTAAQRRSAMALGYLRTIPHRLGTYGPAVVFWEAATGLLEGRFARAGAFARGKRTRAVKRYLEKLPAFQLADISPSDGSERTGETGT